MLISSIEARVRAPDVDWIQPVRDFVLEGLDEIATECRPRWRDSKHIPTAGLALPDVQVRKVSPSSYFQDRGGSYRGYSTYAYDSYYPRAVDTEDIAFEQAANGTLTLFDTDISDASYWLISGTPWWAGMRDLAEALEGGTDATLTVQGTVPDLYVTLNADWNYVEITGPDLRILTEGRDYVRSGLRITFTDQVVVDAGMVLTLQVWEDDSDVNLGVPTWVVEVLQARLRWHLEEYTFGTYHGSVAPHQIEFGPIVVNRGNAITALSRSAAGRGVNHPARDNYWRLMTMHGQRSSGLG